MSSPISHQRLAEIVGGELAHGDPEGIVTGLNSLTDAVPGEVTFFGNARYFSQLKTTQATAVLVAKDFTEFLGDRAYVQVENPTLAFSGVIKHFAPPAQEFVPGVHPSAAVDPSASFDPQKVSIGANAVIEENVVIGDGTIIRGGVFVGQGTRIGKDCLLHANCTLRERTILGNRVIIHSGSAIGTDGFGYEFNQGRHLKVEQLGIVQIDDDVEIGGCTTIDRARFGRTWIGEGTKIDNLVQIAHNVVLGKHCIVCAQVGISGSTHAGNYCTFAGQAGVAGHLRITDQVTVLGRAGVTKDLKEPGIYLGYPAKPLMQGRKLMALPAQIPNIVDRIRQLEKKLAALEAVTTTEG
jgi:UDP-3-O-[3-hydroxymyristoyl] glucosamine N-acyltransferase